MEEWTVDQVDGWLSSTPFAEYAEVMRANKIDGEVLLELDADDLHRMGIVVGQQKRLLRAIGNLRQ